MNTAILILIAIIAVILVVAGIALYMSGRRRERDNAMDRQTASEEARLRELADSNARSQEAGKRIDAYIAKVKKGKPDDEDYTVPDSIVDIINKRHS